MVEAFETARWRGMVGLENATTSQLIFFSGVRIYESRELAIVGLELKRRDNVFGRGGVFMAGDRGRVE